MIIKIEEWDCNRCHFISLTETQQRLMKNGNKYSHYCNKYNVRIYHNSQDKNAYYRYPCDKCAKENKYVVVE